MEVTDDSREEGHTGLFIATVVRIPAFRGGLVQEHTSAHVRLREAALLNVSFLETEISVEVSEIGPSTRQIRFVEDRLNGTLWHAGTTVDAFSGVDVQHLLALVN